ncbi:hypothetical protein VTK26DRAFT_1508 [Humicola hyalothermophila]
MMPAQGRPAAPSLPPVNDEATIPFSDLFNGFDRATIDAAAQLADKCIFVASNGRRYRIESIPDPVPNPAPPPPPPPPPSPPPPARAPHPAPEEAPAFARQEPLPTFGRAAPLPIPQTRATDSGVAATWGRSPPNGSAQSYSPGRSFSNRSGHTAAGGVAVAVPGGAPHVPTDEVMAMMSHLSIHRFGATPLYGLSDGGVQAAETLTDPDLGPRSPTSRSPSSPRIPSSSDLQQRQQLHHHHHHQQQQQTQHPSHNPSSSSPKTAYDGPPPPQPHTWTPVDYANYTAQANAHLQQSRKMAVTATGLPSLLEGATALTPPTPHDHRASDPLGTGSFFPSLVPDDKEVCVGGQGADAYDASGTAAGHGRGGGATGAAAAGGGGGRGGDGHSYGGHAAYGNGYLAASPTSPTSPAAVRAAHVSGSFSASASAPVLGRQQSLGNRSADIDTLTPVVVHHPAPQPSAPLQAPSFSSDGASTGRDNVLPGEDLLFDGPVKSAQTLSAPAFRHGVLKAFRNTLTNDLRFHCRIERESETYWMKANNAQLVPAYAYDLRLPYVVYIRDRESDKGSGYMGASQGNGRPSGIYQFSTLKELFDFQAKLTGEKVVLDIGSVRMVTISKANSRSSTQFSSARLQIWHEIEGRRTGQSDVASFVTAGTTLSGPLRERLVASSSRLILYLGRSGEYITCFITDDLEIKVEGQTLVKLKPRKGTIPFSRKASRWPWVKAHWQQSHGTEPAGFDIHGRAVDVDVGSDYDSYKTFEIEFENSPSQDNFIRKWDEVMRERRLQRARLQRIQEDMEAAVFTGRQARGVFT